MSSSQTVPAVTLFREQASKLRLPELLAPAGDWACAKAAVENGADAIYFGLERFNARMRAQNFTEADLPPLLEYLHRRGVKGYVTFNTLVFENEMAEAEQYARAIIAAGADAAIVQDVGICRLIRRLSSDFPIHVSTQMTITSAGGIQFARELGCDLVVLARECSLKEIEKIVTSEQREVSSGGDLPPPSLAPPHPLLDNRHSSFLPLEVFIHGALCVAYSGQCLTSEALGGRSANRGECAQACRMPYELVADGQLVQLGDRKYLLSPQDLAGVELLPELARLGIASLKIEGRLKAPEYVANITRIYRSALDRLRVDTPAMDHTANQANQPAVRNLPPTATSPSDPAYEMQMAFSRGLYTGWFRGVNNQALVHGRFGKKRGVYLGQVSEVRPGAVVVRLEGPLKPGDGVVFDAGCPEEKEEGGRVYGVQNVEGRRRNGRPRADHPDPGTPVRLTFGRGDIDFNRVQVGDRLWKTSDPELERRLRQSFAGDAPRFLRPLSLEVHGVAGKALTVIASDDLGHVVRLDSAMPLSAAERQPLTTARLNEQLGRLGGTPFKLGELKNHLESGLLLPLSELNRLRREMVAELEARRAQAPRWTFNPEAGMELMRARMIAGKQGPHHSASASPCLIVLVRNLAQLEAALDCGVETLYCEFEDPKKYREAVARFREFHERQKAGVGESSGSESPRSPNMEPGRLLTRQPPNCPTIWVAPPRIFKMGEDWTLKQVRSSEADGYLIRNYDHLGFFVNERRIGDYSFNIANRLSAHYFKHKFGLERVTASYDLNFTQLEALLQAAPPEWFEVTIHQHIPMFHMEHCVFCAFLSAGTDYTNCGRPCDVHDLKLRDRVGAEHPVKADAGCRNTVFNALAQTGAEYVARMLALGVRHFRLEFLNETPGQLRQTVARYQQLLTGEITGSQLWRELKLLNQLGVTRGQIAGQRP